MLLSLWFSMFCFESYCLSVFLFIFKPCRCQSVFDIWIWLSLWYRLLPSFKVRDSTRFNAACLIYETECCENRQQNSFSVLVWPVLRENPGVFFDIIYNRHILISNERTCEQLSLLAIHRHNLILISKSFIFAIPPPTQFR